MKDPTVSIVILHYNGLDDTRRCIRSLLADGEGETDREILIWDNGSPGRDGPVLAKEFGDAIRVHISDTNYGYAGGNNRAAAAALGRILVILNNDTEVTPGWQRVLVESLERDPNLMACQPKLLSVFQKDTFDAAGGAGGFIDAWGYPYVRGRLISFAEKDQGQYNTADVVDWACGACMVVRKKDFLDAGGFDEDFFAYMEEIDLCWKWRRMGKTIEYRPASVVYHRGGSTWKNRRHRMLYHKHRNGLLMLIKHLSWPDMFVLIPLRLLLEWVSAVFYFVHGSPSQAFAPIRSFFVFFTMLPSTLRKRVSLPYVSLRKIRILPAYFLRGQKTFTSLNH